MPIYPVLGSAPICQQNVPDPTAMTSTTKLRTFLAAEVALFALASLLHRGIIAHGFGHARAAVAEGIIAVVLAIGLAINVYSPGEARAAFARSRRASDPHPRTPYESARRR